MGYACYTVYRRGQELEAGYAVDQLCDTKGCTTLIDRGLDHLCGETPGDPEHGCGGYHCSKHMYFFTDDDLPQLCAACSGKEPQVPDAVVHEPFHQDERTYLTDSVTADWSDYKRTILALQLRSSATYADDPHTDEARRIGEQFTAHEATRIDAFLAASAHDNGRLEKVKASLADTGENGEDLRWTVTQLRLAWDRLDRLRDHIDQGGSLVVNRAVGACIDYPRWSRELRAISPCVEKSKEK